MPYGWVEPEVFVEHSGVKVFHIYKNDFVDEGRRECWFTTDVCGGDSDDPCAFDVRDLSTFEAGKPYAQAVREAIDKGELKQEKPRRDCGEDSTSEKRFAHVILYSDPEECYVGMDVFETFPLALAQFQARLRATREEKEEDPNWIKGLVEDVENQELHFLTRDGYEVLYYREEIQRTLGEV